MLWRCAGDFFQGFVESQKRLPRINFNFFVGAKTQKIKGRIVQILQSHSLGYGDVQVIFLMILLKFIMAAMDELHNFLWSH